MSMVKEQVAGFVVGILSSVLVWWVTAHVITPKIKFSKNISAIDAPEEWGREAYRVKFENSGWRKIIDLSLAAVVRVPGLNPGLPDNVETTYLPLSLQGRFPNVLPRRRKGEQHLIRIRVAKKDEFSRSVYPPLIILKAEHETLTLEDVLSIGSNATVQIVASGYDGFSGARKIILSQHYRREDIVPRRFQKDSLEVA